MTPAIFDVDLQVRDANSGVSTVEWYLDQQSAQAQPATAVGTAGQYRIHLSALGVGSHCLTIKATDTELKVTETTWYFAVSNPAPVVRFAEPLHDTWCAAPASLTLMAEVTDLNDRTLTVEFFANGEKIGDGARSGFSSLWTCPWDGQGAGVPAGTYDLTVRATDPNGAQTTSSPVRVMVKARPTTESSACVRLFKLVTDGAGIDYCGTEITSGPVGGRVGVAVQLTLGPGERLADDTNTVVLRVRDEGDPSTTSAPATFDWMFDVTNANIAWWQVIDGGTANEHWERLWGYTPKMGNPYDEPLVLITTAIWETTTMPSLPFSPAMGHNGAHSLCLIPNGDPHRDKLFFQQDSWPASAGTTEGKSVTVKNLVITDINALNGNKDYLKYDPDPDSPHNRPQVTFTFEDEGDPHTFYAWVMIQKTGRAGMEFVRHEDMYAIADTYIQGWLNDSGDYVATWDGAIITNRYPDGTFDLSDPDEAEWGTYTYDVIIAEYDHGVLIDQFAYKWPYCLTVGAHDIWVENSFCSDTGTVVSSQLKAYYTVYDFAASRGYSNYDDASDILLSVVDNTLTESTALEQDYDPAALGAHYGIGGNGILLDEIQGDYPYDGWRVIITGKDKCWVSYRRNHEPTLMLAVNAAKKCEVFQVWYDKDSCDTPDPQTGEKPLNFRNISEGLNLMLNGHGKLDPGPVYVKRSTKEFKLLWSAEYGESRAVFKDKSASYNDAANFHVTTVFMREACSDVKNDLTLALDGKGTIGGEETRAGTKNTPDSVFTLSDVIKEWDDKHEAYNSELSSDEVSDRAALTNVIIHELGHAMGLAHLDDCAAQQCIMSDTIQPYFWTIGLQKTDEPYRSYQYWGKSLAHRKKHLKQRLAHIRSS